MTSTSTRPLARLETVCREALSADELVERAGNWIADATGADAHVFLRLDPLTALWTGGTGRGHAVDACEAFIQVAFLRSEYADYGRLALRKDRVVEITRGEVASDPYTNVILDGFGFLQELHVSFAAAGQAFGALTLSRRHEVFEPAARRLVSAAVAPVTQHLRRLLAKDMLEAVPGEELGLMLVGADGTLTPGNGTGEAMLRHHAALPGSSSLRTALAVVTELARRSLATTETVVIPRVVYVEPGTQRRYRLLAETLRTGDGPKQVLVIAEPMRALDSVELLRTAGLTEREAEVAMITLRGFKSVEGADALHMAESTFLGHLKHVYRKLGVGSRGELASLLLGGL